MRGLKEQLLTMLIHVSLAALLASNAQATGLIQCEGALVLEGCEPAVASEWPPFLKLQAVVSCETCSSAPGGPLTCQGSAVQMELLSITQNGADVGGTFAAVPGVCDGSDIYQYTPHLAPGDYQLMTSQGGFNMVLASFTVLKPSCNSDNDCFGCESCMPDGCTWTGTPKCTVDSQCPAGQQCYTDPTEPCLNVCGDPPPPPCESDEDCGPCAACTDGDCYAMPGLPSECDADADCEDGFVCVLTECSAFCEEPACPQGPDCDDAGAEPEADAGAEPETDAGAEPETDAGAEPEADAGSTEPTSEPEPSAEPESTPDAGGEPSGDANVTEPTGEAEPNAGPQDVTSDGEAGDDNGEPSTAGEPTADDDAEGDDAGQSAGGDDGCATSPTSGPHSTALWLLTLALCLGLRRRFARS